MRLLVWPFTASLFIYLIVWTKDAESRTRFFALLMAIPALLGITFGIVNGRSGPMLVGVSITIVLLILYRALSTPLSYRFAYRAFQQGNDQEALNLLNKAIEARPKFWESYQLESMIYLTQMKFEKAEESAKQGLIFRPNADTLYNTLGQIYLAQTRFVDSQTAYASAIEYEPHNGVYWYYLALNQYRLQSYRDAAESFSAAIKNTLRYLEFELMAHYLFVGVPQSTRVARRGGNCSRKDTEVCRWRALWCKQKQQTCLTMHTNLC